VQTSYPVASAGERRPKRAPPLPADVKAALCMRTLVWGALKALKAAPLPLSLKLRRLVACGRIRRDAGFIAPRRAHLPRRSATAIWPGRRERMPKFWR
jgi:hypothetical protein